MKLKLCACGHNKVQHPTNYAGERLCRPACVMCSCNNYDEREFIELVANQDLPTHKWVLEFENKEIEGYSKAQQNMLAAGFRKVVITD